MSRIGLCFAYLTILTSVSVLPKRSCQPAPTVTVIEAAWQRLHGIRLKWRIANDSDTPIYVYSTFLSGQGAAGWNRRPNGVFEMRTSLMVKVPFTAYSYPQAVFKKIEPHSTLEDYLSDPADELKKIRKVRLSLSVAYGSSITAVQEQLQELPHVSAEHPGNPIVEWQCIAWSQVFDLNGGH